MKYGMPAVLLDGTGIAGYAAFAEHHCGYYPFSGSRARARRRHRRAPTPRRRAVCASPVDEPLSADVVRELVRLRLDELGRLDELA